ncbi:YciI family protein [Dyella japonica]|uniref:YCII-related domain-containing protein n=1 Tax=Dyella japonica TaxID=231455 RepID=A0ABV2JT39_9GAMM
MATDIKVAIQRYLISFDDGSMDHIPAEDLPSVGEAAHEVLRDAKDAGVWIFGCGLERQQSTIVATDGTVTAGPVQETKAVIGGFSIIEVSSREEAHRWAARIAVACRCAQEVREIMFDPES